MKNWAIRSYVYFIQVRSLPPEIPFLLHVKEHRKEQKHRTHEEHEKGKSSSDNKYFRFIYEVKVDWIDTKYDTY